MNSMEKSSEILIRSTLHDLANVLAGIRGILDLTPPGQPLAPRDRDRMGAVIDEGVATLDRSRHLALDTQFPAAPETWEAWRNALLEDLEPLAILFRCRFQLELEGPGAEDAWPGKLLRSYARAVTRQVVPYAKAGVLTIACAAVPEGWRLRWAPVPALPENLAAGDQERPMDIAAHWAVRTGVKLGVRLSWAEGALQARIPRGPLEQIP
jgi:hypothetical protein